MIKNITLLGMCIAMILCLSSASSFAETGATIKVPAYHHEKHPKCGCNCKDKIIYTRTKVTYDSLLTWSKEAITAAYSYGFGNYQTALQNASQYFTPKGWTDFADALEKSGNLSIIANNKLIVSAIPAGEPKVIKSAIINGLEGWQIQIPILAKYESAENTIREPLQVTLKIVQTEQRAGIQGLGIQQIIVEKAEKAIG